ncbi:MAG: pyridoxal-phosphate dependent enzyme [Opitutales bacterium]
MNPLTGDPLFQEILNARQRIYSYAQPTPLEILPIISSGNVFVKREDLSPIHAYKWRGAFNKMASLDQASLAKGVITASAGNHAQGVALAARLMETQATIYMPRATPRMKQEAVRKHGGDHVEIRLEGDTFSEALDAAVAEQKSSGKTFVHAYDDLTVMGGQGTLADEVVMSGKGPFDRAYIQIGGGGLIAGVACWLKVHYPGIEIIGVEGERQASMNEALKAGKPVDLDYVDVFCDGTAVRKAGENTFAYCQKLVDRTVQVSNDVVSGAIKLCWETLRCTPEPSGALGIAGAIEDGVQEKGGNSLVIICGANMDLSMLSRISARALLTSASKRFYRFEIGDQPGTLLKLMKCFPQGASVIEFQYARTESETATPVLGIEASEEKFAEMEATLRKEDISFEAKDYDLAIEFGILPFQPNTEREMCFFKLEFHERSGALSGFLEQYQGDANICYFNYRYSGEIVGRALLGFELSKSANADAFFASLPKTGPGYRAIHKVSDSEIQAIFR